MPLYESVLIARQDVSATQVDDLVATFQNVITENGGSVGKTENWSLRTMAYKIKKNRKGHYVLMNIDAPSAAVLEMERQMRINEDILRYLTLRVDEHETEPSAVVRNKGSDDRPRGRGRFDRDGGGEGRPSESRDATAAKPATPAATPASEVTPDEGDAK
ncbi:MAG: 30S ribosomal protein S6 [Rhodospirillales bacterium]|nr:30S ribosomal protein S6 [Rhodospirillales bacterium]